MRGLADLFAARRAGRTPALVLLDADPGVPCRGGGTDPAHLVAEATDRASRLDLRCLIGLPVAVSSTDAARIAEFARAATAAGAARVVTTLHERRDLTTGEAQFAPRAVTDTEGVLSWHR